MNTIQINKSILNIIKSRPINSHKGTFGKVLVIAGSKNYGGAAILSSSATLYSGAGLVTLATDPTIFSAVNTKTPEIMTFNYNDDLSKIIKKNDIILIGPGLVTYDSRNLLLEVIKNTSNNQTVVIDASSIQYLTIDLLNSSKAKIIITPHQMEWQNNSGIKIQDQNDKNNLTYLSQLKKDFVLILKSHKSKIYTSKYIYENIPGNPGMAIGGSGDTLSGILAGFIAQFGYSIDAICAALYTHSDIANELYKENYIVLPEKIIQSLPKYMKKAQLNN
ncbi:NAD(P)H-hydrate dehydratase [Companilactobacillus sp. DQM5]|uniref:NAD(P)H-hydrate dehydratase n=1 Tax=Companilactobacillus sp. DQM5 TaxID=3463359 RepID=UPI0040588464